MEAIDEFETERDQQGDAKHEEGPEFGRVNFLPHVGIDRPGGVKHGGDANGDQGPDGLRFGGMVEIGADDGRLGLVLRRCGHDHFLPEGELIANKPTKVTSG
jgi:hypothetical protein